jgi:hypothetical protein
MVSSRGLGSTRSSLPEVLEEAVETFRRQSFLQGLAADFAALRGSEAR